MAAITSESQLAKSNRIEATCPINLSYIFAVSLKFVKRFSSSISQTQLPQNNCRKKLDKIFWLRIFVTGENGSPRFFRKLTKSVTTYPCCMLSQSRPFQIVFGSNIIPNHVQLFFFIKRKHFSILKFPKNAAKKMF